MSYDERKREYNREYTKRNLKRVPLEIQLREYEVVAIAARATGESVNGYIKGALRKRLEDEGYNLPERERRADNPENEQG